MTINFFQNLGDIADDFSSALMVCAKEKKIDITCAPGALQWAGVIAKSDGVQVFFMDVPLHSIKDMLFSDELLRSVAEATSITDYQYVMLRGPIAFMDDAAVRGAIILLQEWGAVVVNVNGAGDLARTMLSILAKIKHRHKIVPLKAPAFFTAGERIIFSLPEIGEEKTQKIIDLCGSAAWALVALTDLETKLPGVGERTKAGIRAALGLNMMEQVQVVTDEQGRAKLAVGELGGQ